jgi:hypothetical protein
MLTFPNAAEARVFETHLALVAVHTQFQLLLTERAEKYK